MVEIWTLGSLSVSAICVNSDPAQNIVDISNIYCPKIILGLDKGWWSKVKPTQEAVYTIFFTLKRNTFLLSFEMYK